MNPHIWLLVLLPLGDPHPGTLSVTGPMSLAECSLQKSGDERGAAELHVQEMKEHPNDWRTYYGDPSVREACIYSLKRPATYDLNGKFNPKAKLDPSTVQDTSKFHTWITYYMFGHRTSAAGPTSLAYCKATRAAWLNDVEVDLGFGGHGYKGAIKDPSACGGKMLTEYNFVRKCETFAHPPKVEALE
jgi:hypothetical protein